MHWNSLWQVPEIINTVKYNTDEKVFQGINWQFWGKIKLKNTDHEHVVIGLTWICIFPYLQDVLNIQYLAQYMLEMYRKRTRKRWLLLKINITSNNVFGSKNVLFISSLVDNCLSLLLFRLMHFQWCLKSIRHLTVW